MGVPMAVATPGSAASPSAMPDHHANAKVVVKRFLDGEWQHLTPAPNTPLPPRLDGDTKVFELTIDKIEHRIDVLKAPFAALGFNAVWPGPLLRVTRVTRSARRSGTTWTSRPASTSTDGHCRTRWTVCRT